MLRESGRAQGPTGSLQGPTECPRAGRQVPTYLDAGHSSHWEASGATSGKPLLEIPQL